MSNDGRPTDPEAPAGFRDLVDLLGWRRALRLCVLHEGGRIWVPRRLNDRHPLVAAIGLADARSVCEAFPATWLNVPRLEWLRRRRRNRRMLVALRAGATVDQVAIAHGVSERTARRLRAADQHGGTCRRDPSRER